MPVLQGRIRKRRRGSKKRILYLPSCPRTLIDEWFRDSDVVSVVGCASQFLDAQLLQKNSSDFYIQLLPLPSRQMFQHKHFLSGADWIWILVNNSGKHATTKEEEEEEDEEKERLRKSNTVGEICVQFTTRNTRDQEIGLYWLWNKRHPKATSSQVQD